ncbi:MAG: DNA-binding protein [Gordonia sp. (in: high G+C Gram-positive bacteria)]|nr:MAG: DNA-binding protein [Gordonia sp. (in: high G+C Gram-positive bacteria)]
MESDIYMFSVDQANSAVMDATSLEQLGLWETTHLERWVIDNPTVLGGDVKIVATQYDKWSSNAGDSARERLDILGLDSSGQTVVVELKRGKDSRIHLQAITYAALVAGFSKDSLAEAHADYLNKARLTGDLITVEEALSELEAHVVEGDWGDDVLTVPRIVLIAEDFSAQTYTTVKWLTELSQTEEQRVLNIEMHTVNAFLLPDSSSESRACVVFRRLYPAIDASARVLTPGVAANVSAVVNKIADRTMRARSVHILHDTDSINEGMTVELRLRSVLNPAVVEEVRKWVEAQPERGRAVWVRNRQKPLRWAADSNGAESWAPTTLAKHIVKEATGENMDAIPGGDVWFVNGESLLELARDATPDSKP